MNDKAGSRLMASGEVAELFGVDVTTVGRWADEGRLPHIKTLGGQRRFNREDVERLKKSQESAA